MPSRAALQRRVIALLGEAFPGEIATTDDLATIDGYIDGKVSELAQRRIYTVQDVDNTDDEAFPHLAVLVANDARAEYRQSRDARADARAESRLREIQIEPGANEPVRAVYY